MGTTLSLVTETKRRLAPFGNSLFRAFLCTQSHTNDMCEHHSYMVHRSSFIGNNVVQAQCAGRSKWKWITKKTFGIDKEETTSIRALSWHNVLEHTEHTELRCHHRQTNLLCEPKTARLLLHTHTHTRLAFPDKIVNNLYEMALSSSLSSAAGVLIVELWIMTSLLSQWSRSECERVHLSLTFNTSFIACQQHSYETEIRWRWHTKMSLHQPIMQYTQRKS